MKLMPVTKQLPISGAIAVKYNLCGIYLILFKISRVGILPFYSRFGLTLAIAQNIKKDKGI